MMALSKQYAKWNRLIRKALWLLAALGVLASVPLIVNRIETESSSNRMEFVFDYRDLLEISEFKTDPMAFVSEQLDRLKEAGVGGLAVYESTLDELEMSGAIKLYSAEDAALLSGDDELQRSNRTYLLFAGETAAALLEPMIRDGFALYGIEVKPWTYNGKQGLAIETGRQEAEIMPLDPDPIQIAWLQERGFRLSVRLSDARPYDHDRMDALLGRLKAAGVRSIIFAGKQVTGYAEDSNKLALTSMAELIEKHGLTIAVIEATPGKQQKGIGKLAAITGYKAVRLHSISEEEAAAIDARTLADRYVLAVKDRNFRMIYLNARMKVDKEQGNVKAPLDNLYNSLKNPEFGAVERIKEMGYAIGAPEPFKQASAGNSDGTPAGDVALTGWMKAAKAVVILGAIALITVAVSCFLPFAALPVFTSGLVITAALYRQSPTLCMQALALLAAVSAPAAAVIMAMREAKGRHERAAGKVGIGKEFAYSLGLFVRTVAFSLVGAVYIVALLNHLSYLLVLNQFRGVSVLHTLPILLTAIYAMFFYGADTWNQVLLHVKKFMLLHIRVFWVIAAVIGGAIMLYYLSRTGNQSTVLPIDRAFRSLLENTFGVRPRTKELLAHPLFIMGVFLLARYGKKAALALIVAGSMAQLSVVDTFAHLHTPLWISALRVLYGAIISAAIAAVYIAAWELLVRGWKRWRTRLLPQE